MECQGGVSLWGGDGGIIHGILQCMHVKNTGFDRNYAPYEMKGE